jgi:hypothetical protein
MGSRLLPLSLALAALLADVAGLHRVAFYLVLLAVVGAAAAAFVGVGDLLAGRGGVLRAGTTGVALVLLVAGSASRAGAAVGGPLPTLAVSAVVLAAIVYVVPVLAWLLAPLVSSPPRPVRASLAASRSR